MHHPDSEVILTIETLTEKGDGLALWQGKKVFIPGALPNEQVKVRLYGVKPAYAQGELIDIIQPSSDRTISHCDYTECGGCQLPHLQYAAQLQLKQHLVKAALEKHQIQANVNACAGMSTPLQFP